MAKKAILVVSFGTSFNETRKVTIDALEEAIGAANPDATVYRAWTSNFIIRKILKRDGIRINTVAEAFEQMAADGITDVVVQPTHIINGIENDRMTADCRAYCDRFDSVTVGAPLLTSQEDAEEVVDAMIEEFSFANDDEAVVFMGHGSEHYANFVYPALSHVFRTKGHIKFLMGTVEGWPQIDTIVNELKALQPKKVYLSPFMIVAGDHANNDLAGDDEDSWKSIIEAEGFQTEAVLKGLGERESIRKVFVRHVSEAK